MKNFVIGVLLAALCCSSVQAMQVSLEGFAVKDLFACMYLIKQTTPTSKQDIADAYKFAQMVLDNRNNK